MKKFLHVYGQEFWHQDAFIVGSTQSLSAIRDAINSVLSSGECVAIEAAASDGEHFFLGIAVTDDGKLQNELDVPYTSDQARERRASAIAPHNLNGMSEALSDCEFLSNVDEE